MIKVAIVDDQGLIREGLQMMISLCDDMEVVGEASNGKEAVDLVDKVKPDVILMDIRMPVMNGVEATKIIKKRYPHIKIIILTTFNEDQYIFQGLKNGANGYILKDVKSDLILDGIKTVYKGSILLQHEVAAKVVSSFDKTTENEVLDNKGMEIKGSVEELTSREAEIAILVSQGKSNKEISDMLFITEGTVKNHLTRILSKLDLRDRTQLALYIKGSHNEN